MSTLVAAQSEAGRGGPANGGSTNGGPTKGGPTNGGPVMATSNIINQKADASRSLYQICVSLRQRLAQVPGFEEYTQQLEDQAADGEPVESLWDLLRTGYPLLVVYNALQPASPIRVEDSNANESKKSKIAVFKFVQACLQELKIPPAECFVINDLLGNDTTGFVKVTAVVNYVLDLADQRGLLHQIQPYPEDNNGPVAPGSKMTYRDHIIKELVDTERKYVQDLENLHDLKKALEQKGVIPGDIVHQIFLNINAILDFQRRFLIRVETTNSMPATSQHWGAPFAMHEESFNIYQPFIANQRKAAQVANQVFDKIQLIQHPVACDFNTLDGFLLKPMQRLVKYPLLLKDLLKKSEDSGIKSDLSAGIEAAERALSKANEAVDRDLLDEALEDLIGRVDDWKNHRVEQFGRLLLHGVYTVVTGRSEQEKDYEIYLFECILLCCKEVQPNKGKEKKDKAKSTTPKVRNKNNKLQLKGRIFMTNVTEVLSFAKPGHYTVQIWWKGDPGVENFVIRFANEEMMKKWATGLDQQRKDNAPILAASPDQPPPDFAWMRTVSNMENPYAQQAESDDDEPQGPAQGAPPSLSFGSQQASTGGVMTRHASSNNLRARSATGESTQSLAGMTWAPPPRFPLPPPPGQLSLQTQGVTQGGGSPGPRGGESYFSPTAESPASTRTSATNSMQFSTGGYNFPKSGTPQPGWGEDNNRYTAPAMPRVPSRDGSSPVNAYGMNGRTPRGPSMPVMSSHQSQQSLAAQRSRSFSTPDINGQQQTQRRTNNSTPVPAVPGIPAHLHGDTGVPRSQSGSPMQDVPIRTNTQSPGIQRDRAHQSHASYGGKMSQFPSQPIYPRQTTPGPGPGQGLPPTSMPQPLQVDRSIPVSPPLGTSTQGNPLFSPLPDGPTQLKVKVICDDGTYQTLVVAFNITYQSMIDRIDAKLSRFTQSSIGKGNLKLRYRDEDGDSVNIESDEDIQIAFMDFREAIREQQQYNPGGVGEIELFCVGDTC
ncbi:Pleckstrin homology domain-containing protein [Pseudomassariella vexata]|uniref:Pleckstrin homology domain-domain-containing protein n=1 Tax=Pseudomassariella vexata TaxID=1141098 RepID=A0A1Y2DZ14_9PEZI|nr:Pleckstrin homology domain-containing protein [Pseudomassariella vexata]ORY64511.1 Pleckstrin homology domain-domain-containing protein [Pseudomassariella vexata]